MTKRQIFAGTMAAILVTGIAVLDAQRVGGLDAQRVGGNDAQGRRGPIPQAGIRQNQLALRQGPLMGGRGLQALGAPGRGFGGRMGRGGRRGGGPLAGLAAVGLTDDQKAQLKTILSAAQAERLAAHEKTNAAVLAILTPEQRAKLVRK